MVSQPSSLCDELKMYVQKYRLFPRVTEPPDIAEIVYVGRQR